MIARLILTDGEELTLAPASCLRCRRLLGACCYAGGLQVWDAIGFRWDAIGSTQRGHLHFASHACPSESRRDLARDAKLEADRSGTLDKRTPR